MEDLTNLNAEYLQQLAASIGKYEVVLEYYKQLFSESMIEAERVRTRGFSRPILRRNKQIIESEQVRTQKFYADRSEVNRLSELMERDLVLKSFLDKSDRNPKLALALAKAEVKNLELLREFGPPRSERKIDLLWKSLGIPALLIVLTAILGNWIASSLQDASFQRNKTFEHKIAILQQGQDKASIWVTDATKTYYDIYGNEDDIKGDYNKLIAKTSNEETKDQEIKAFNDDADRSGKRHIIRLQKLIDELDAMTANNDVIDTVVGTGGTVATSRTAARDELLKSIKCLEDKQRDWNILCNGNFKTELFDFYRKSIADATIKLLGDK